MMALAKLPYFSLKLFTSQPLAHAPYLSKHLDAFDYIQLTNQARWARCPENCFARTAGLRHNGEFQVFKQTHFC